MNKILAVNAGSSSLKFQLLSMPSENVIADGIVERIGHQDAIYTIKVNGNKEKVTLPVINHSVAVEIVLKDLIQRQIVETLEEIKGVGHRVVHGGEKFKESTVITPEVLAQIEAVSFLAPLHNPGAITGIEAFQAALPNVTHIAVFDTAFHQTMAPEAFMYATPYEWYEKYGVRKYGFHGTSHQYVSTQAAELMNIPYEEAKIITVHLGNGASLAAVKNGKSVDTSMGMTPLAGIPMGTRSGDIDPAIIEFIASKENKTIEEVIDDLNKKSGYLGVSGLSNDSRDLEDAAAEGHKRSNLALDIQYKRITDYIASYYVYLGGADAIVFTAGIGENNSRCREVVCDRLSVLGVKIDYELNNNVRAKTTEISTKDSKIKVYLIPTNEELVIARDTVRLAKL